MKIGFIGLGNVGGKLAGSLLRNGFDLTVRDLNEQTVREFIERGAIFGESPKQMVESSDLIITCLPSPAVSAAVMESQDGILAGMSAGKIWAEMSTTDEAEVIRLGEKVQNLDGSLWTVLSLEAATELTQETYLFSREEKDRHLIKCCLF